ncbi:hypothetical protein P7K49_021753 [Saguinus oedipus]|uniref:Uncharacterized protein n=1 Tax=Saguinus oedipus TaxID=9490 RepID=A0ABQ9UUC5_SAGOE|nr:hypothetical protein P7K49_021753 [Saguinus oedipus]
MCPVPPACLVSKCHVLLHCLAMLAREEGPHSLYKGSSALLFWDSHSFATYFLSYAVFCSTAWYPVMGAIVGQGWQVQCEANRSPPQQPSGRAGSHLPQLHLLMDTDLDDVCGLNAVLCSAEQNSQNKRWLHIQGITSSRKLSLPDHQAAPRHLLLCSRGARLDVWSLIYLPSSHKSQRAV